MAPSPTHGKLDDLLVWLAQARNTDAPHDANGLSRQLRCLRALSLPPAQHLKLLDLLYRHGERIVQAELPELKRRSIPISGSFRQRIRPLNDMLDLLSQDYFNRLACVFDPTGGALGESTEYLLRRALLTTTWQIHIHHLVAAPPAPGLWQQLHAAFRNARQFGMTEPNPSAEQPGIAQLYTNALLAAIAQPASFTAEELEFIDRYLSDSPPTLALHDTPPEDSSSTFWIDPDKDVPAHALVRRTPATDTAVLYFCCQDIATRTQQQLAALNAGQPAVSLGLPSYADTPAGRRVLKRLAKQWGTPAKRRFPRRRQSQRVVLHSGLATVHGLLLGRAPTHSPSEWMVTNESPDGYALMHIQGSTEPLRVGDLVALRDADTPPGDWQIYLIRWAISENPEHLELGLQMIARQAHAASVAHPEIPDGRPASAIVLPASPPLRLQPTLITPGGLIEREWQNIVLMIEQENIVLSELHAPRIAEQTAALDLFEMPPDAVE